MIIQGLMELVKLLLTPIFSVMNIPGLDAETIRSIDSMLSMIITNGSALIGMVMRWSTVRLLFPILIAIILAEQIYSVVMWVLRKIPVLGIE